MPRVKVEVWDGRTGVSFPLSIFAPKVKYLFVSDGSCDRYYGKMFVNQPAYSYGIRLHNIYW
ncbi:MAG: hypothetical protein F6K48_14270 [Okeania sp. SIO3H1]|uniref:hypothetical protein n=1 Tax=Okeania sp. SIO1I7 TaxID=2607772 RepID=UPI0013CDAF17|nr:hypothetical protein [Okeania sp. SIO1I7]NEN90011.1 hypothetical protein [Okeania sp. SIO3H1]NET24974.1 hypothetical protein [Okeania sp. SIO1I7]